MAQTYVIEKEFLNFGFIKEGGGYSNKMSDSKTNAKVGPQTNDRARLKQKESEERGSSIVPESLEWNQTQLCIS